MKKNCNILIIEDDKRMLSLISEILSLEGYDVLPFDNPIAAIEHMKNNYNYGIILTDLKMPDYSGLEILKIAKEINPTTPVIIITAHGTIESAVTAIKNGAYDFIQKPFDPDQILMVVNRACEYTNLINENIKLHKEIENLKDEIFIGQNKKILQIKELINKISSVDVPVLITGETGTGKELVARLIFQKSSRKNKAFIPINCGALSEGLLESELFGHEKGSFTGATSQRKGIFETFNGGTIFLDEINSSSLNFQTKLLRVLQDNKIIRMGSSKEIDVDIRMIFATNSNLEKEIQKGNFRKDLYYRISLIKIEIPPLRERKDDILLLANYFLTKKSKKYGKEFKKFSDSSLNRILNYEWPGNVRELENCIEKAVILGNPPILDNIDISSEIEIYTKNFHNALKLSTLEEIEKQAILNALHATNFNKTKTSEILGINPSTLWRKLKQYNIDF